MKIIQANPLFGLKDLLILHLFDHLIIQLVSLMLYQSIQSLKVNTL